MRNKFLTKIVAITLGLAMAVGVSVGMAESVQPKPVYAADASLTFSDNYSSNTTLDGTAITIVEGLTVTFNKASGSTAPQYYTSGTAVRWYAKGTMVFDSSIGNITNITLTFGSSDGSNSITANPGTFTSPSWSGSATKVTFTQGGTSGNRRIAGVSVTYSSGGQQKDDIDLSCDNLTLDVLDSSETLNISATSGGSPVTDQLSYSYGIDNTNVATVSNSGVVSPVAPGSAELTISFAGNDDYNSASKTISVTVTNNTLDESNLVFAAKCNGSGLADNNVKWAVTSNGAESTFEAAYGIHYGTNNANVTYVQLSTSDIKGSVKKVIVNTRDAQATATISVMVGTTSFTCAGSSTATNSSADYVFSGDSEGSVTVRVDRGSSMSKAIYVKSIIVLYDEIGLSSITLSGDYPIAFNQGDQFSHEGMTVTANYDDGVTTEDVTSKAEWTGYNMTGSGEQTVTVTYSYKNGTVEKTAEYTINITTATMYTVGGTIANGSLSSTDSVREDNELSITINANARYSRPASLDVTMGDDSLVANTDYQYNPSTGAFSIEHVTGNVTINGECGKKHGYWLEDPYTVAEAISAIDAGTDVTGVYASGVVSGIAEAFNESYGNISYNLSANGSTTSAQLQAYRGKDAGGEKFTSANDVEVGGTAIVYGNLEKSGSTYRFASGNQLESYDAPSNEQRLSTYLNSASSIALIDGEEHRDPDIESESIIFGELGLENGVKYSDPFDGGNFTITFAGGDNDGKYYNDGSAIRVYGNGSFTIASSEDITTIELTFVDNNTYKPTSNDVVNEGGTYDKDTCVWNGSSKSVVFTRPSGAGHWRLQSLKVTYGEFDYVDKVSLRFGATIPVASWDAINAMDDYEITGYGVALFRTTAEYKNSAPSVESLVDAELDKDNPVYVAINKRDSSVPLTPEDGYYSFASKVNITKKANYDMYFCAQAFVIINGTDYRFVGNEIRTTAKELAAENDGTNLSSEALTYIANYNNNQQNQGA